MAETLNVFDSMNLLKKYEIPLVETIFVKNEEELHKAIEKIDFPVAMKVVSSTISHKTDAGGVKVNIFTQQIADKAFENFKKLDGFEGALVQKMAKGKELIIGGKFDEQFGPTILFGLGGIFVEIFKDASIRICPITKKDAKKMITEIKGYPLLAGARGEPPVKIEELEEIIMKVNNMMMEEKIKELDINPLIANEKEIVAVDARIVI